MINEMNPIADLWGHSELASHWPENKNDFFEFANAMEFFPLVNSTDYAYVIIYPNNTIVISFCGTKNLMAWISDFDIYPLRSYDVRPLSKAVQAIKASPATKADVDAVNAHFDISDGLMAKNIDTTQGFFDSWNFYSRPIREILDIFKDEKISLFITGHSRGGALAALCAMTISNAIGEFKNCKPRMSSLVTFGSPRVFTKASRNVIDYSPINYTNIHHGYEFTRDLPPEILGFKHAGKQMDLKEPWWHSLTGRISDHYYSNYTKALLRYYDNKTEFDHESYLYLHDIVLPRCTI